MLRLLKTNSWFYMEYASQDAAEKNHPFHAKVFYNHEEMKTYSAERSAINRLKYPDYCSNYIKFVTKFTIRISDKKGRR